MNEKEQFIEGLRSATEQLLGDPDRPNTLCAPLIDADPPKPGAHLNTAQVEALNARVLGQVASIAQAVYEAARVRPDAAINMEHAIAQANEVFNRGIPARDKDTPGVESGFMDTVTEALFEVISMTDRFFDTVIRGGGRGDYFYDLHLGENSPNTSMIKDVEILIKAMQETQAHLDKLIATYRAHDETGNVMRLFEKHQTTLRSESPTHIEEPIARARLLLDDFNKLSGKNPPANLKAELAFHYQQTFHLITNMMAQYLMVYDGERQDPGCDFVNHKLIAKSYAERFSAFLEVFRIMIMTTNTARRTHLLLECRGN